MKIAVLPGDGIGPEVVEATVSVLEALGPSLSQPLELTGPHPVGIAVYEAEGEALPDATLAAVADADAALFGAITSPLVRTPGYRSPILRLRQELTLFANVRPCASVPHASSRDGVDLVVVRENTEGLYAGRERTEDGGDTAISERVITRAASERIVRYACELAQAQGRKRVTLVHKANVLRESDGLFREAGLAVAKAFPGLEVEERLVDACAMDLIRDPGRYEVIVTTNLFGDILSDEACMLVGGLGLACSGNIGANAAVFEPVHGSAPDIAGQGIANPLATVLSAALMLEHLGEGEGAARLRAAVNATLEAGETPRDLGGGLGTNDVAQALAARL
jgi:homoisocitrate dehydrogenase